MIKHRKTIFAKFMPLIILIIFTSCQHKIYKHPDLKTLPPVPKIKNVRVAVVLGGGGARSIAHLGVLEVLEENNIPIDLIVGTSAGSAVGALYADDPNIERVRQKILGLKRSEILDASVVDAARGIFSISGPIKGKAYEKFFEKNLINKNIESFKIPFIAMTTDIMNNQSIAIGSGPAAPAIHASSAIPPFFAPVELYGKILVDGGVIEPVPVRVAKTYNPQLLIAIDISSTPEKGKVTNMITLTYRALEISYYELSRMQSKSADIDIHPKLEGYGIFDDNNYHKLYMEGRDAAIKILPEIKKKITNLKPNLNILK